ncbi:MAG: hypothetical protein V4565_09075 [Bacteroidota bacterium]
MNKEELSRIFQIITGISIIALVAGTIIINGSLQVYQIVDYSLLKPHAMMVGGCFLAYLLVNIFVFSIYSNFDSLGKNTSGMMMITTTIKITFLTILFFFLLHPRVAFDPFYSLRFLNYQIKVVPYCFGVYLFSMVAIPISHNDYMNKRKNVFYYIYIIFISLFLVASFLLVMVFHNNHYYKIIAGFEYLLGFYFFSFWFGMRMRHLNISQDGSFEGSIFSKNRLSSSQAQGIQWLTYSVMCIGAFSLINSYSQNIFPFIKQSNGGGMMEKITYYIENDSLTGNKLYETENDIFIMNKDSTITVLKWDNIIKIGKAY